MAGAKRAVTPTADDVRAIALSFEGVSEVDHWKRPAWRTVRRMFAVLRPDGLYLNLPEERKEFLFAADPQTFVKYMWGRTANVILQIERVSRKELEALLREAYEFAKPAQASPKRTKKSARS
jgi:hypothetical protein